LSVVVPALDAEIAFARALPLIDDDIAAEIVVAVPRSAASQPPPGVRIVAAPQGRGSQLRAGARAATGEWLLFLHADTQPDAAAPEAIRRFILDPANRERAGYFRLRLDDPAPGARRVEMLANWRARILALPYGDQGLLIRRAFYEELDGHPPLPIMEDVALVRRLGRERLARLDAAAVTSAARYARDGYWLRPLRNLFCLALYFLGVPPARIAKIYG